MLGETREALDRKLREELAQLSTASDAKHDEARGLAGDIETRLRQDMQEVSTNLLQMVEEHQATMNKNAQYGQELREEIENIVQENHLKHSDSYAAHQVRLDELEGRFKEENARLAKESSEEHKKHQQQHTEKLESLEKRVHEAIAALGSETDEKHNDHGSRLKKGLEALDDKLTEQLDVLHREHKDKHDRNHKHVLGLLEGCDDN